MSEIEPGAVFRIKAPFMRTVFEEWDVDGIQEVPAWRPGARDARVIPIGPDDATYEVDAEGEAEFRVVSRHRPPGFPERVFYVRAFVTPDGKRLNGPASRRLRIAPIHTFRRMLRRWPVEYVVRNAP